MVVDDPDLETLIDTRATATVRKLEGAANSGMSGISSGNPACTLRVEFLERRRKNNSKGYFTFGLSKPVDEEYVWETWVVKVTICRARSEREAEALKSKMEESLRQAAFRVVELAGGEKDHIPPITTMEGDPFPYRITVDEVTR